MVEGRAADTQHRSSCCRRSKVAAQGAGRLAKGEEHLVTLGGRLVVELPGRVMTAGDT